MIRPPGQLGAPVSPQELTGVIQQTYVDHVQRGREALWRTFRALGAAVGKCERCGTFSELDLHHESIETAMSLAEVEHAMTGCDGRMVEYDGTEDCK